MRTSEDQQNLQSKQRLRMEINSQIETYLHNGGRIEVLGDIPEGQALRQIRHWPAATDLALAAGSFSES